MTDAGAPMSITVIYCVGFLFILIMQIGSIFGGQSQSMKKIKKSQPPEPPNAVEIICGGEK